MTDFTPFDLYQTPGGEQQWMRKIVDNVNPEDHSHTGTYAAKRNAGIGIYVPLGWGQWWRAALAAAGATPAVCALVGDSITRGFFAGALLANGWGGQVGASLRAAYGDGGSGFKGVVDSAVASNAMTQYVSEQVALSAAWILSTTLDGPGSTDVYTNTPGATATFNNVRGTSIRIFLLNATSGPPITYSIDGGAAVADTTNAAASIKVITVAGLAAGNHTVVITHTGTAAQYLNVLGVSGENTTGVRVDNYGRQGGTSAYVNPGAVTYGQPGDWSGGPSNPADLIVYGFGVNDANANIAPDTYLTNVEAFLSRVRGSTNPKRGKVDLVILVPHLGTWGATKTYSDYLARLQPLAETYGAALIDIWTQGMNSYNRWADLGYWSSGNSSGVAGNDGVHPRTQGHNVIAAVVTDLLTASI